MIRKQYMMELLSIEWDLTYLSDIGKRNPLQTLQICIYVFFRVEFSIAIFDHEMVHSQQLQTPSETLFGDCFLGPNTFREGIQ